MGFLGVYRALYDYEPAAQGELAITEGDLLFVLDRGEDDWWKAKKKAPSEDEDEPEGLIPMNYIEEAVSQGSAKALYDYTRQTDEELSFSEDEALEVYDTTDPDWTLVGAKGEYGFAPANYIEMVGGEEAPPPTPRRPQQPTPLLAERDIPTPSSSPSPIHSPAAALAGIIQQRTGGGISSSNRRMASPPPAVSIPSRPQYTPEESEEEQPAPRLPSRPKSEDSYASPKIQSSRSVSSPVARQPSRNHDDRQPSRSYDDEPMTSPGRYHIYNIFEMVEVMGKSKKMKTTLGINAAKGTIMISAEGDPSSQEWTAEKLRMYNREGKHVFMELVRPSKSVDFHAGAKDTAEEICSALGELAGAARAEGLREVIAAGTGSGGPKKGKMIYEFMAQGDDEVTVAEGDEVLVLDDSKSDEWWVVRRLRNGKEGVVPSSYVDILGAMSPISPPSTSGINAGRSYVEQNRLEEERLAKQASKKNRDLEVPGSEVGPGLQLPKRHSSLMPGPEENKRRSSQKDKRSSRDSKTPDSGKRSGSSAKSSEKEKSFPDMSRVRTWTDRSGSFKVEAQFLALKDEKIHLHKMNGVKIAVPVTKMALADLEYVERATGTSLEDLKPIADLIKKHSKTKKNGTSPGATISKKPEYDWFDFFLSCGIDAQKCERYAQAFTKDEMGEESMEHINPTTLRTLGLKEGDNLRVMTFLNKKFNRQRQVSFDIPESSAGNAGGLFSGAGGVLRDNSRKGRPVPPVETKNEIDPNLFKKNGDSQNVSSPSTSSPAHQKGDGFDDDAWAPRASKNTTASPPPAQAAAAAPPPHKPALTPGMAEMSLLDQPLQPTPAPRPAQEQASPPPQPAQQPQQPVQPTGATPSLFEQLANSQPQQQQNQQAQGFQQQQTGFQQQQGLNVPRQRPVAPQQTQSNSLIAPPPQRAASVPQNFQNQGSGFAPPPLQAQLTGYQPQPNMQTQVAPPGQSLQELQQQRVTQQQSGFMQPQQPSFQQNTGQPNVGFNQFQQNGIMPQTTGYNAMFQQNHQQQNMGNGAAPFLQPQPTGYQQALANGQSFNSPFADPIRPPFQPQATGVNAFLPPALMPQATGVPASQLGQFGNSSYAQQNPPPMPPMPPMPQQQQQLQPLRPQKTGPPPPVRFGTQGARKLAPQPTGRRANLAQATPDNPFGF